MSIPEPFRPLQPPNKPDWFDDEDYTGDEDE